MLWERLDQAKGANAYKPVRLMPDIGRDTLAAIEVNRWDLPGIVVNVSPRRDYIFSPSSAHLIGYMGEISVDELKRKGHDDRRTGDFIGKYGIEREREPWLRGNRGGQQVEVNATGQVVRVLSTVAATPGHNIVLSIDQTLQMTAETLLGEQAGAAVAWIRPPARSWPWPSSPSFDQNAFITGMSHEVWNALISDPRRPLENKAIQAEYPPASTYKIIIGRRRSRRRGDRREHHGLLPGLSQVRQSHLSVLEKRWGHGEVNLLKALSESCDVYFYKMGQELGVDRLAWYAKAFGLGSRPAWTWTTSSRSGAHRRSGRKAASANPGMRERPCRSSSARASIWSPRCKWPWWSRPSETAARATVPNCQDHSYRGRKHPVRKPARSGREIADQRQTLQLVRQGLFEAVNSRHGTAWRSRLDGMAMGGKTGTAQVVGRKEEDADERRG